MVQSRIIREPPPCMGCTERFTACSGKCPKDERGEFGYKAWMAKIAEVKKAKREFVEFKTVNGYKLHWESGDDK